MSGRQGLSAVPSRMIRDAAPEQPCAPSTGAASVGRCLRLPMFTAVSMLLALTAHGAAQRMTPDAALTVAAAVAVTAVGAVLCRRRRSFETIAGGLVVAQVLAHVILCLDHFAAVSPTASAHFHAGAAPDPVSSVLAQFAPDPAMAMAHLLAAGVAGWWLSRGEAAVWSAASRWWASVRPAIPGTAVVVRPLRRVCGAYRVTALHDEVAARRTRPRRGPPLVLA